jgi:iron complex transport system substrate-binding protein
VRPSIFNSLFFSNTNVPIHRTKYRTFLAFGIIQTIFFVIALFSASSLLWANSKKMSSSRRIISTSPSITETLFELGLKDRVIAVTDFCKYPEEACRLPSIGGMLNPNMEKVISLTPDLIIHQSGNQRLRNNAKSVGIKTLEVRMGNLEEIFDSIKKLGVALNCQEQANKLTLHLTSGIAFYQEQLKGFPKKEVLLLLGDSSDPARDLYAAGPGTFLNELLNLSGGTNIIRDSPARYPKLSKEHIIKKSPEIIIEAGPKSNLPQREIDIRIQEWNRFPTIEAVKKKQIYFIGADYILIPGPRLLKTIEQFSKAIHPNLFSDHTRQTSIQKNISP